VKQGCSLQGSGAGEANSSLRLVSFLEETQRRTWLNMKAVLSKYVAILLDGYFSLIRCVVLYLSPLRICIGPCQLTMLTRAQSIEMPLRARFAVCLTSRQCKYYTGSLSSFT
jgi:hypothetical protein